MQKYISLSQVNKLGRKKENKKAVLSYLSTTQILLDVKLCNTRTYLFISVSSACDATDSLPVNAALASATQYNNMYSISNGS